MKKIVLLTLCALSLFGFAACKKAPSFFEKTGYEAVSNRVLSECVVKEGDLYYRYVNGERTGEGYASLTAANSPYTVYAYLENPTLTLYNSYLAQKQNGAWVFIHSGEELLLPEGEEWSFTMPYLAGKKTQTLTDENGKTSTQTTYAIISLNNLNSDLSRVEGGAIVAPFLAVGGSFDFNQDDILDGVILLGEDDLFRVYDASGNTLFQSSQSVACTQKMGKTYFKTYDDQTKQYSLYAANGTLLISGASYLADEQNCDYFIAATKGESGAISYTAVFNGAVTPLPESSSIITAAKSYLLYAKKEGDKFGYYRFSGAEPTRLPYEIVSASSHGDAFIAWKTETSTLVDVLNADLQPVFTDLPEDVQISPLSDAQNGVLCFYSKKEEEQNGYPTARFITPNGTRTLRLFAGEKIRATSLFGYYEIYTPKANGAYETCVYNLLIDQKTTAFDALSLRYENGIKYVLGISYSQNTATVLDGATLAPVHTFALQNAESALFNVCYTEEFLIAQTATDNAMPVTVLSLTEGETTTYHALYRAAAYGENFDNFPLKLAQIAAKPQFSAANNLLVTGDVVSTVYRVTTGGLTQIFAPNRKITGAFSVGKSLYYVYEENAKTGVINDKNSIIIPAEYDGVSAQVQGMLSLKKGEGFVLAVIEKDKVLFPSQELFTSLELYSDGVAVAVENSGEAALYHNGKKMSQEPLLSCNLYYDVEKAKGGGFTVKPLFVFSYEEGAKLFSGKSLQSPPVPVCSIGSYGDDMPAPVYYLTYVYEGQTLKTDRVEPTHDAYVLSVPQQQGQAAYFFFDEACTEVATRSKVFSGEYGTEITLFVRYHGGEQ